MNITSTSLRAALGLSVADRRWIDFIAQSVQDTWDDCRFSIVVRWRRLANAPEADPSRPNTMGYMGSEEFIRLQFEEYLLALVASVKYHMHLEENRNDPKMLISEIGERSPATCTFRPGPMLRPSCQKGTRRSNSLPTGSMPGCGRTTSGCSKSSRVTFPAAGSLRGAGMTDGIPSAVDSHLFDIVEPRHPCAGALTIEDIQRRLSQCVVL